MRKYITPNAKGSLNSSNNECVINNEASHVYNHNLSNNHILVYDYLDENDNLILENIPNTIINELREDERFSNIECNIDNKTIVGSYNFSHETGDDVIKVTFSITPNEKEKTFTIEYNVKDCQTEENKLGKQTFHIQDDVVNKLYNIAVDNYYEVTDDNVNEKENNNEDNKKNDVFNQKIENYVNQDSQQIANMFIDSLKQDKSICDIKCNVDGDSITCTYNIIKLGKLGELPATAFVTITRQGEDLVIKSTYQEYRGKKRTKIATINIKKLQEKADIRNQLIADNDQYDINNPNIEEVSLEEEDIGHNHHIGNKDDKVINNNNFGDEQMDVDIDENVSINNLYHEHNINTMSSVKDESNMDENPSINKTTISGLDVGFNKTKSAYK